MPALIVAAFLHLDAKGCTVGLDSVNRLEKLSLQFLNLPLCLLLLFFAGFLLFQDGLLFLDFVLYFTVNLVDIIGELLDTKHIAMIGECDGVHAVLDALFHQVRDLRHAVEDGVMRVDVEVGEVFRHEGSHFALLLQLVFLLFFLVKVAGDDDVGRLDLVGIGRTEILEELFTLRHLITSQHPDADQFKEHAGCRLHVGRGVVGRVELGAEEDLMELVQFRQLIATALAAGQLAELSSLLGTGVHPRPSQQRVGVAVAEELAAHDAEVEVDVMSHEVFGFLSRLQERVEHLMQRQAVFGGMLGGDAVHHLGFDGDDETIGLHQQVVVFHKTALVVVELPSQLHQSRPVVEVS